MSISGYDELLKALHAPWGCRNELGSTLFQSCVYPPTSAPSDLLVSYQIPLQTVNNITLIISEKVLITGVFLVEVSQGNCNTNPAKLTYQQRAPCCIWAWFYRKINNGTCCKTSSVLFHSYYSNWSVIMIFINWIMTSHAFLFVYSYIDSCATSMKKVLVIIHVMTVIM